MKDVVQKQATITRGQRAKGVVNTLEESNVEIQILMWFQSSKAVVYGVGSTVGAGVGSRVGAGVGSCAGGAVARTPVVVQRCLGGGHHELRTAGAVVEEESAAVEELETVVPVWKNGFESTIERNGCRLLV